MLRKIPNYEYRDNNKNTSDSSSGCEDDFDADDSYVNDGDEHETNEMDPTAAVTALNLSPMPHFPPPPDYPPPAARTQTQTPQRSRYYYYENSKTVEMNGGSRRRVGSLDRDCGYTTDGNEICSQYNRHNGSNPTSSSHSANNSFSSTSSSSNSSVVMHKMKMPSSQMRYQPPPPSSQQQQPPLSSTNPNTHEFDNIEIFSTEQEKRFPHKTLTSLSKSSKNKMHHDSIRSGTTNSNQNINVVELFEQNLIPFGGSAASFARESKLHANAEPQVSFMKFFFESALHNDFELNINLFTVEIRKGFSRIGFSSFFYSSSVVLQQALLSLSLFLCRKKIISSFALHFAFSVS